MLVSKYILISALLKHTKKALDTRIFIKLILGWFKSRRGCILHGDYYNFNNQLDYALHEVSFKSTIQFSSTSWIECNTYNLPKNLLNYHNVKVLN